MLSVAPRAHDIPNDVTIQAFLEPEGNRLHVLVRVPLVAMRDMDYPRRGALGSGMLDVSRADSTLRDAATLWVADDVEMYEQVGMSDVRLPYPTVANVQASLPSDRSFLSYDGALAHVTGPPLPADTEFLWSQGLLDIHFVYPIQSENSRFSMHAKLDRLGLRTLTVLRFITPDGGVHPFEFPGDPGLVRLDPRWYQSVFQFTKLGFTHILDGTDHLLFLLCLVIPFRRLNALFAVVTSFAAAHSITLIASAYNLAPDALWFPPLVDTLIAVSIVYMALENIVSPELQRRWLITFGFGLAHGFAFWFALRQLMQFAGSHALMSLVSFNVGIELGQLLVLILLIPALDLLFKFVVAERLGTIILSVLIMHTGWHWMIDRGEILRQYRFEWPVLDAALLATLLRWLMLGVAAAGMYWLLFSVWGLTASRSSTRESSFPSSPQSS
ncbi:MAG TPA: HupE/UreJ family protein [Vicinamibacterales bacterium]|nr:HupE/UreJ family protein [Vicinamibacterales bacterium]